MKLITFARDGRERPGVLTADGRAVRPVAGVSSMTELIRVWDGAPALEAAIPLSDVEKRAPIPAPEQDILCLGMNYRDHAEESARFNQRLFETEKGSAVYFSKRASACVPDGGVIPSHSDMTRQLDYEAELAVILGRDVRSASPEEVPSLIFGYTVINDVSARDVQKEHKQFYFGKSLDGFTPLGPCILTADEAEFPPARVIWSRVNGELRQNSVTDRLIFSVAEILCDLSRGMTLRAGTIIATGTPAGTGMGMVPPRFLQPGDVVECGIEGIGTLTNTIV